MACVQLQAFLDGELSPDEREQFEQHLGECRVCQDEVEAAVRFYVLGAQLAQRPDRPQALIPSKPKRAIAGAKARVWMRARLAVPGGLALVAAAAALVLAFPHGDPSAKLDREIADRLSPRRTTEERLPYAAFDRHRDYDTTLAETAPHEQVSDKALAELAERRDRTALIAAYLARGELGTADDALSRAGAGDDLDVERAILALRRRRPDTALTLLDQVISHSPRHPQALWNRAIVLENLDLPLAAAEAFDAALALLEPGWSAEAVTRSSNLRARENQRALAWTSANQACDALARGVVPDLDVVRRRPWLCRPALAEAVRHAGTREQAMRLLPVAQVIDAESGDTGSSELVERAASADFKIRGPSLAIYRALTMTPALSDADKAGLMAQLRASGQDDLVLGALLRTGMLRDHQDEYARLAKATGDAYFAEIAVEYDAVAKRESGRAAEAEHILRDAVAQCTMRAVERRCAYLYLALAELYIDRHEPTEATKTVLAALDRSRRLGLYWDERLLFSLLSEVAKSAGRTSEERAYSREAKLRQSGECLQLLDSGETAAHVELRALRFASARAELDRAPRCGRPPAMVRTELEAELVRFDGTPQRIAELRADFERTRRAGYLTHSELVYLDAIEGRLVAAADPATARPLLARAIDEAGKPEIDEVQAMKIKSYAYRTLLVLGAADLDNAALLELFATAARVQPRPGCALGALIDGERLLLIARDAGVQFKKVFAPHAFKTPDFDVRTLVPAELRTFLAGCARVDVIALPPVYGRSRLLPPELAWSYRGPAGQAVDVGSRSQVALTVADARPPSVLGLQRLQSPSRGARGAGVDQVIVSGPEATPERVRKELAAADFVEIHAHGIVDPGVSDVPLIALSPEADGSFALTAPSIAALKLERAPFVALAACYSAYTAPYLHEPWGLPYAFLQAGARGVLAPTTAIPDKDSNSLFRTFGDQILRGADPAAVLRDQRMAHRQATEDWVNDVVLFD